MARFDIMPGDASLGGHNRTTHVRMGALSTSNVASTSWKTGEVGLLAVATGDIDVIPDGTENITINHYIFATDSAGEILTHNAGEAAATYDFLVPVYPLLGPDAGTFITQFAVTGSDVLLTAAEMYAIPVGEPVGLWRDNTNLTATVPSGINGRFSVDTGATGLRLLAKLDANGRDCDGPNGSNSCVFWIVGE